MQNPRCLKLFESACRSERTRKSYVQLLNSFLKWGDKDYESLLVLSDSELQILLEDYMMYCRKRYAVSSIRTIFASIEKFLFVNDRTVNKKKLMMFLPEKLKTTQRAITTEEIRLLLKHCGSKRNSGIIHVFSATGCRPEALADLKIKNISEMPEGYTSIIFYAGTNNELQHFYHPEVTSAVNDYLDSRKQEGEKLEPESYLFRQKRWLKDSESQLTVSGIESIIENLMKHAGIKRIKQNEKRYDLPVCNGFRNRFNTILKRNSDISYPIAEKFLDHKLRMEPSYLFPTKQELFDEYKKAVPELMVSEEARLKLESENKQKHIEKLETEKDIQMKDMQEQIDSVKELLRRKDS
ncbi:MAG: tyrosine-type recombinase/integrase [Candidatus Nitrosopelagicus sp.]|jgi:integrase|nr:tyrosine-type recombinase/integrase [Candidatus Nitrosopelagicus sp.]